MEIGRSPGTAEQFPQPHLQRLLSRTAPAALEPRFDFTHPNFVRRCGRFHSNGEPRCRSRCISGESATPEFSDRERGGFIERARRDLNTVPDAPAIGEGDKAGVRGGHLEIILLGRTKSEYGEGPPPTRLRAD
jgi:hypothetical protein